MDFGWANSKVTEIASTFSNEEFVAKFLGRYTILKADARSSFFSVEPCLQIENVSMGRPATSSPFFLHVLMSFIILACFSSF